MVKFVQVPVPRELVFEVMRWVLFRAEEDADVRLGDRKRFAEFLARSEPDVLRLLALVAEETSAGRPLRLRDLGDLLDLPRETTQAIVDQIQEEALGEDRSALEMWPVEIVGIDGRKATVMHLGLREHLVHLVRTQATVG